MIKKIPDLLTVEIVQPKKPEAAPVILPEPPKPAEQIKPLPEQAKPLPKKELKPEPMPIESKPETKQSDLAPMPAVIAAEPKADAPPAEIKVPLPPPEPPKKTEPNDNEINAARDAYIKGVQNELQRNHRYPKIAQNRGVQGEVKLRISIDSNGNVSNITILESSGNASLDEGAIATVKRSNLKQLYPEILRGRDFTINTPIVYTIEVR